MTIKTFASVGLALILIAITASSADARSRRHHKQDNTEAKLLLLLKKQAADLSAMKKELAALHKILQPEVTVFEPKTVPLPRNRLAVAPVIPDVTKPPAIVPYIAKTKLKQLVPGLALKVSEIMHDCGTTLVSGYRRGARVLGSGRPSLHSRYPSQAADLHGNPKCIYSHLKGWPGGYSIDYAEVNHVHVSLSSDSRERHARFVHYGHKAHYYAHHHDISHRRLARLH